VNYVTKNPTPEQVKQWMMEVVKAIEEANVPDDLRVIAFEKTFDALIGTETPGGGSEPGTEVARRGNVESTTTAVPSLGAVASRLGLEPELVSEIFYIAGDSVGLAVASSKLDPKKAAATQQIALLIAAGRQASGLEEWTHINWIRDACRDYGRFDVANFASTIKRMGGLFGFRGRARQLEVRLTRPGFEQAAELARQLGGV
jgi:hypothetical protein